MDFIPSNWRCCAASANPENRPCPEFCTADFTPVCAVLWGDYRTFGNECELARYSCQNEQRKYTTFLGNVFTFPPSTEFSF